MPNDVFFFKRRKENINGHFISFIQRPKYKLFTQHHHTITRQKMQ